MTWLAQEVVDGAHVVPLNDLVGHELTGDCVCGPVVEHVGHGWLYVHASLDGRELTE